MRLLLPAGLAGLTLTATAACPSFPASAESLGGVDGVRYARSAKTALSAGLPNDDPTVGSASRGCRKGWQPVSGGVVVVDWNGWQRLSALGDESGRFEATGWSWQGASSVTGYVVCLPSTVKVHRAVKSQVSSYSTMGLAVECPAGTHVISGGVSPLGKQSDFAVNSHFPYDTDADADLLPDDGWASAVDHTANTSASLFEEAVCVGGPTPAYRQVTVPVYDESARTVRVPCPRGREVVGGGAFVTGSNRQSHLIATRPYDNKDANTVPEDGWLVRTDNPSDFSLEMTAYAICR